MDLSCNCIAQRRRMVKSTQVSKNRLSRQFCSVKLLQIAKNTENCGRKLEKHYLFVFEHFEHFSFAHPCRNFMFKNLAFRFFLLKQNSFFFQELTLDRSNILIVTNIK